MAGLNLRKRGNSWEWRFERAPINGKRQWESKGGYKTKAEAVQAGTTALDQYNNTGRTFNFNDMSVADYLDYWLEVAIKKNINHGYSHNTYSDYESKIRLHLKPAFGMYKLSSFQYSSDLIQSWIDDMKIKGFSRSMIKNTLACLSGALNYAIVPLKYIQANPCAPVKVGKIPMNKATKDKIEYVCPVEEFKRIIERFPEGSNFHLPLMVPYHLGTRIGETYGIDLLNDVDFDNHTITINHQLQKEGKTWFYRNPKYDSIRTIPMGPTIEKLLRQEITNRKKQMLLYGQYYTRTYIMPDNSICQFRSDVSVPYKEIMPLSVKENGELLTPESFKYCARVIHYDLGNSLFHAHCLRHTHGTILAEQGVNPKTVMERLGHKDIKTTLQIYTFNTDKMQSKAVELFEDAIG